MARPIEATPPLDAEDSERLLRDIERTCSPEESERRYRAAAEHIERRGLRSSARAGMTRGAAERDLSDPFDHGNGD